jgi:hypothetical protein
VTTSSGTGLAGIETRFMTAGNRQDALRYSRVRLRLNETKVSGEEPNPSPPDQINDNNSMI